MFFRFILLGISLTFVVFFMDILLPKLKSKIKMYKENRDKEPNQTAFKKKVKELEIQ